MRKDTFTVFLVVAIVGSMAVFGGSWMAGETRDPALTSLESEAGLDCQVSLTSDWEVGQGVYWTVARDKQILQKCLVAVARPNDNANRKFAILTVRGGRAVALWQSTPEPILMALYDSESGAHWPGERNLQAHQKLWHEIASGNGISGASYRDFNRY